MLITSGWQRQQGRYKMCINSAKTNCNVKIEIKVTRDDGMSTFIDDTLHQLLHFLLVEASSEK